MRYLALVAALTLPSIPAFAEDAVAPEAVAKPAALVADGIPAVPVALAAETRPYMEFRTASFVGWHPTDKSMVIATRFGNTAQLHRVAMPMGARNRSALKLNPSAAVAGLPKRPTCSSPAKTLAAMNFSSFIH